MLKKTPKVSIVVLNWNGMRFLEPCITSLLNQKYKKFKIIVVDNGSKDGSQLLIKRKFKSVTLIENKKNLGWTGGNNVGVLHALKRQNADCVYIVNNDTVFDKLCLTELIKVLYADNQIGIVGPKLLLSKKDPKTHKSLIAFAGAYLTKNRYFGMIHGANMPDTGLYDTQVETEYVAGAALMVKSDVFKMIGNFDNRYFIYYDEADFCLRVRKAGYKVFYVPKAVGYHAFSGTVKVGSPFQHYYTTRNHYLFVEVNAPVIVKLREWLRTPKTIFEHLRSNDVNRKKYSLYGIRDYYLRRFGKRTYWSES